MNSLRFNGGALNSARVVMALAFVSCTSTATVDAAATTVRPAQASITVAATVSANPYRNAYGVSSAFIGQATLTGLAKQNHRAYGEVLGQASLVGYCLQYVPANADFTGSATASFVPASVLSSSDILTGVLFSAEAYKTQYGFSSMEVSAAMALQDALANRGVVGNVSGSGELYAEVTINGIHEAYTYPIAESSVVIQDSAVVIKQVGAILTGTAEVSVVETQHHRCHSSIETSGNFEITGITTIPAAADIGCSVVISSTAQRICIATGSVLGTVYVDSVTAIQQHSSHSDLTGTVELVGTTELTSFGYATITGQVVFAAAGEKIIEVYADTLTTASLIATASANQAAMSEITVTGYLEPIGYRNLLSPVPPERSFVRPKTLRTFSRNSSTRTFGRA